MQLGSEIQAITNRFPRPFREIDPYLVVTQVSFIAYTVPLHPHTFDAKSAVLTTYRYRSLVLSRRHVFAYSQRTKAGVSDDDIQSAHA